MKFYTFDFTIKKYDEFKYQYYYLNYYNCNYYHIIVENGID